MKYFFLISIGVVLILSTVFGLRILNDSFSRGFVSPRLFVSQVSPEPEALYFVSPSSGTFAVNDTFQVELLITASEAVTSFQAYLDYNPSLIAVTKIDRSGSSFTMGNDTFDNISGELKILVLIPSPGFSGNNELVTTITFQAMSAGTASLTYNDNSLALIVGDTDILNIAGSTSGSYTLFVPDTPLPSPPPPPPSGGGPPPSTTTPPALAGDCNSDGKVNIFDISIMISSWGKSTSLCDLNSDRTINIFDISILITNWTG